MADWESWKGKLGPEDRAMVGEGLEAGNTASLMGVKDAKRRKRALADGFREFRRG